MAADYSTNELFAILLARDFHDDDRVVQVGANLPMARAAVVLASLTRLPDLRIVLGLAIENLAGGRSAPPVYPFVFDPRSLGGGEAYMFQHTIFDDMSWPDVFFVGGLQVDRRGNVNLLGLPAEGGGWRLRGPGAVALPTMSTYCRGYYILMPRHDPRSFVAQVAYITALGDRTRRRELGFSGGGPRLLLSPLGVFDFDDDGDMRARSLHPGVTSEQAQEATSFDLNLSDRVPETEPPTEEELSALRERVDVDGILRSGS